MVRDATGEDMKARVQLRVLAVFVVLLLPAVAAAWQAMGTGPDPGAAVSGRVTFSGTAPAAEAIDMSSEAYCRDAHRTPVRRRRVRLGDQNSLVDVIVHVKGAPGGAARPVPAEPVVLDQRACMYEPPVLALRVGQTLVVRNSDDVLHNVHVSPKLNRSFNLGQPMAGMESRRAFRAAEVGIPVRCDIHDWMEAAIGVFDHSFFAVTGEDGRFTIDGLPPGEYELEAWHPALGTQTQRVRVPEGGAADLAIVMGGR